MPFWKQSDDPWDRNPDKPRNPTEDKEPQANPLDSLKSWNEDRKTAAREKEEAKRLPPETCPWCGKDMEQGYIMGGRDAVHWHPGVYKFGLFRNLDGMDLLDEGTWVPYKTAWVCRECGKMILSIPEAERVFDIPEPREDEPSETTDKEETSEEE